MFTTVGIIAGIAFGYWLNRNTDNELVEAFDFKSCLLCGCTIPKVQLDRLDVSVRDLQRGIEAEKKHWDNWKDYRI